MVRSTILLSAIVACIGSISAIPTPEGTLVNVDGGHHIGADDVNINNFLNGLLSLQNAEVQGKKYYFYFFFTTLKVCHRCRPRHKYFR
jgi:hypothetical protein